MKRMILFLTGAFAACGLQAAKYYWVGSDYGSNEVADATDLNNWSIVMSKERQGGTHPAALPTASDDLHAKRDFFFDMNGQAITFNNMNATTSSDYDPAGSWGVVGHSWQFTNGVFSAGTVRARVRKADHFTVWPGGTFIVRDTFIPGDGMGGDGIMRMYIMTNAELRVDKYRPYNGRLLVEEGGLAVLGSVDFGGGTAQNSNTITNRGELVLSTGVVLNGGSTAAVARLDVVQAAGRMTLGGPVSINGQNPTIRFFWNGGTVRATNTVTFSATVQQLADEAEVTAEVATNSVLDLGGFIFGEDSTIVKKGPGQICFGETWVPSLYIEEGYLAFRQNAQTCGVVPSISAGAGILFAATGVTLNEIASEGNVVFAVDQTRLAVGDVFLHSSDNALLEAALAGVNATLAAEEASMRAAREGDSLKLVAYSAHVFDATSGRALDDPEGWGGVVPAGQDIDIAGAGTVDFPSATAFASIRLRDGATLRVVDGTEETPACLPPVQILGTAKLLVAANAYACFSNELQTVKMADTLPIVEIATNGAAFFLGDETTVYESSDGKKEDVLHNDIRFKNVDLRVYGRLITPYGNVQREDTPMPSRRVNLYLGTAGSGETAEMALTVIGGSIEIPNSSWYYGFGRLLLACPEAGGRVIAARPFVLRDATVPLLHSRGIPGTSICKDNPTDEHVVIEVDNTVLDVSDSSHVCGGADVRFSNGGTLRRFAGYYLNSVSLAVRGNARLSFADSDFVYCRAYDYVNEFSADTEGTTIFSMTNGMIMTWALRGNGKGVAELGDVAWFVADFLPKARDGLDHDLPPSPVFNGFKEARIAAGTTFSVIGTNYNWRANIPTPNNLEWDREIDIGPALAGGGDLVVDNAAPTNTMTVTIRSGANTCTGTAEARVTGNPLNRSTLRFADGANWAGTVVANGCVELFATNAVGAAVPATVSFGSIRLDDDFPIRVWKTGEVTTNDVVSLAGACTGSGRFVGVPQAGYVPAEGDAFGLGLYPANQPLPVGRGKWNVESVPVDGDPEHVQLRVVYRSHGLIIFAR